MRGLKISLRSPMWLIVLSATLLASATNAQDYTQQWRQGLSGTRLSAYSGSVVSSNSTLTVIDFCHNGRYRYYKEGSWSVPGQAGGASNSTITGSWDIQQAGGQMLLVYRTDQGQQGSFQIYLQNDNRVNIGGVAYSAQQGASGC